MILVQCCPLLKSEGEKKQDVMKISFTYLFTQLSPVDLLLQARLHVTGEEGEGGRDKEASIGCNVVSAAKGEDGEEGQSPGNFSRQAIPEGKIWLAKDFYETLTWGDLIPDVFMETQDKNKIKIKILGEANTEERQDSVIYLNISNTALHKI